MFRSLPRVARLRKKFFDTFWTRAVLELERKLRFPNKTLKWYPEELDRDLIKVAGKDLSVLYSTPSRNAPKTAKTSRKTRKAITSDGKYRKGHSMTLRPRKGRKVDKGIAALDPGVRTFQTLYDTDNNVIEFGNGDVYNMSLDCKGLRSKIKKIHSRLAKYLCDTYGLVMIPRLDIPNSNDPYLAVWDHPGFVDRLFRQAKRPGVECRVIEVEEAWTSKTCSGCGKIGNPGWSKTFKCKRCGLVIDRDINGARNILLKNMNALGIDLE